MQTLVAGSASGAVVPPVPAPSSPSCPAFEKASSGSRIVCRRMDDGVKKKMEKRGFGGGDVKNRYLEPYMALKLYGVNAAINVFVFVYTIDIQKQIYCIINLRVWALCQYPEEI